MKLLKVWIAGEKAKLVQDFLEQESSGWRADVCLSSFDIEVDSLLRLVHFLMEKDIAITVQKYC